MDAGPTPPDLLSKQLSFVLPVVYDSVPSGASFGSPVEDAKMTYKQVRKYAGMDGQFQEYDIIANNYRK